jgi:hypothetical protein
VVPNRLFSGDCDRHRADPSISIIGFAPEKVARDRKVFCIGSASPRDNKAAMKVA